MGEDEPPTQTKKGVRGGEGETEREREREKERERERERKRERERQRERERERGTHKSIRFFSLHIQRREGFI